MTNKAWIEEFPGAVTVCDSEGKILEMNEKACQMFEKDGGASLIGKNLLDCHPVKARQKLERMMVSRSVNCYTIEKNGIKKFIYQSPWYQKGKYTGFVELVMEIPFEVPHYSRS